MARPLSLEAIALLYVALPNAIFFLGWIVAPYGLAAAFVFALLVTWTAMRLPRRDESPSRGCTIAIVVVAVAWCLLGGEAHLFYANSDWWVRDAVLLDLVREPWPVVYRIDGIDMLLRTPVGFYLPAALVGKVLGLRAAEFAMTAYSSIGVSLVFAFICRDRPSAKTVAIRLAIFVLFSGMDILPTIVRNYPYQPGAMIEWWARYLMYGSSTTLLFWAPNHTIPGWVATAWLVSRKPTEVSGAVAALFVATMPVWAPLTAAGFAVLAVAAMAYRLWIERSPGVLLEVLDFRVLLPIGLCVAFVYPYLLSGSGAIRGGAMWNMPWIGAEYHWRYLEFITFEFAGLALLLLSRRFRDPVLWAAIAVLMTLPLFYFGPYNDLNMRGSIPALALLAIGLGRWLTAPLAEGRDPRRRIAVAVLLAIGAVTPLMEFERSVANPAWPMNVHANLAEITRGTHYLTPLDQPWLRRFVSTPPPAVSPVAIGVH